MTRGCALWLAGLALGFAAAAEEPRYVARLRMPSPTDTFGHPRAVTADLHTGELFVCDSRRHRIVIFDAEGLFLYQIPGGEVFRSPLDLAADPDGFLLVLARRRGEVGLLWLDFDGKHVADVELSGLPEGLEDPDLVSIALAPQGDRVYALDRANQRLWIAGRDGVIRSGVGVASDIAEERVREHLLGRVDVYGDRVVVARASSGDVRFFSLDGDPRGWVGLRGTAPCQLGFPVAAALGEDEQVVVLDQQRMHFMVWDARTNRCLGEYSGIGNAPGFVYQPSDLALDGAGRVYVSQGFEGRVQVFAGLPPASE